MPQTEFEAVIRMICWVRQWAPWFAISTDIWSFWALHVLNTVRDKCYRLHILIYEKLSSYQNYTAMWTRRTSRWWNHTPEQVECVQQRGYRLQTGVRHFIIIQFLKGGACSEHRSDEKYIQNCGRKNWKVKGRAHLEDRGVDGRIIWNRS